MRGRPRWELDLGLAGPRGQPFLPVALYGMRGGGSGPQERPLVVTVELSLAGPGRQGTGCLVTTHLSPSLAGSA